MKWLTSIFSFLSGLFSFLHDRKVEQGAKAADKIESQNEELEAIKDAENIKANELSDNLLVRPDQRGHNVD